jgi:hypothetical protein
MAVVDSSADSTTVFGEWFLLQESPLAVTDTAATDLDWLEGAPVHYYPCVGDEVNMTGILRYSFAEYRIAPRSDEDIEVLSSGCPASAEDVSGRHRLWLAAPKPNPFAPQTTLRFHLPQRGTAELGVYGVDGRLVRRLVPKAKLDAGIYAVEWDGRNGRGSEMPSGLYFLRLTTEQEQLTEKLMLVR